MAEYLIYDPATKEAHQKSLSPEHVSLNTNGGQWHAFEIDGLWRKVSISPGSMTQTLDFEVVRRPLLRKVDEDALALTADPFAAIHAAKEAEARLLFPAEPVAYGADGPHTPLLDAEAEDHPGQDRYDIARDVLANAERGRHLRAAVERTRIAAKRAIRAAETLDDLIAASTVDWPS